MNTPSAQIISLGHLHAETPQPDSPTVLQGANPLHAIRTRLQVCVGAIEMSVGELMAARENQVIALDREVDQAVDLMLEGKVVARGQLVALDGRFALRITELPAPLKL